MIGGGPAGATAANDLASAGVEAVLLDKAGRIKPCGGAIPPKLIEEFAIPDTLIVARAASARMISPSNQEVDMPIEGGYVGMVDREHFDEWLRDRAAKNGAQRVTGKFTALERDADGMAVVCYQDRDAGGELQRIKARCVIAANGANSALAKAEVPGAENGRHVLAYHEIVESPAAMAGPAAPAAQPQEPDFDGSRCSIYYQGRVSPDFYAWVFPHGPATSVGVGSAQRGFSLRKAVSAVRETAGLSEAQLIRSEGAPIPLKPLPRWDNGHDLILAGDAAGAVAPASGEGIYYAMATGRFAAEAAREFLVTGKAKALRQARRRFMRAHGKVFWVLGIMQTFWYSSDKRRERFVNICRDPDVQYLTWQAYMHKKLVRARPLAHVRIFLKDMAHLLGLAPTH